MSAATASRPEIGRLELLLRASAPTRFPHAPVVALHAALHRALGTLDAALATAIHDAPEKPLTVGPPRHADGPPVAAALTAGAPVRATLTALDGPTLALLLALGTRVASLDLERVTFAIEGCTPCPPAPDLPALTDYRALRASADAPTEVRLVFRSPTGFRNRGETLLHPEPRLVFGGLLRRWNTFAPPDARLAPLTPAELDARVSLREATLQRAELALRGWSQPGFTGRASFAIVADETTRETIATLARYAGYAGIGARVALGMGQVTWER